MTVTVTTVTEVSSAQAELVMCAGARRMPMALTAIVNRITVAKTKMGRLDVESADVIENMVRIVNTVTIVWSVPEERDMCAGVRGIPMVLMVTVNRITAAIRTICTVR